MVGLRNLQRQKITGLLASTQPVLFPTPPTLLQGTNPPTITRTTNIQAPPSIPGTALAFITQLIQLADTNLPNLFFNILRDVEQNVSLMQQTTHDIAQVIVQVGAQVQQL